MDIFEAIANGVADELKQNGLSVSVYRSYVGHRYWEIEQNESPHLVIALQQDAVVVHSTRRIGRVKPPFTSLNCVLVDYSDPELVETLVTLLRGQVTQET